MPAERRQCIAEMVLHHRVRGQLLGGALHLRGVVVAVLLLRGQRQRGPEAGVLQRAVPVEIERQLDLDGPVDPAGVTPGGPEGSLLPRLVEIADSSEVPQVRVVDRKDWAAVNITGLKQVIGPLVSRLSGEAFALEQFSNVDKLSFFVSLLASVNLVLFLFNLVPLYPLDGGHVAGALYEKARSTVARLRGRPDPGPFDIARLMPVAYAVAGLFILLSGLLVIADVVNPITLQ